MAACEKNLSNINSNGVLEDQCDSSDQALDSTHNLKYSNGIVEGHENDCKKPEDEVKAKKKVNIYMEEPNETTAFRKDSVASNSYAEKSITSNGTEHCLTMTGTVKRGKKAGQNLDIRLNMSREELEMLDASIVAKEQRSLISYCGLSSGPHVTVWSIMCFPFVTLVSSIYSFYMGTLMWYNIFTYVTEEAPFVWRILLSPLLILLYPPLIMVCTVGVGLYAGVAQISWFFDMWDREVWDLEKGFFNWLCSVLKLEDCAPYDVIVLTDVQASLNTHTASQDTLAG